MSEAGHDHSRSHGDHRGHEHDHLPKSFGLAFGLGIALNTLFVIVEAVFGITSNSTALLADAGHNLSDVFGLLVAWGAAVLSQRAPTTRFTYGLRSSSILAALFNAMFLLTAVGAIAWEAVQRFATPEPVAVGPSIAKFFTLSRIMLACCRSIVNLIAKLTARREAGEPSTATKNFMATCLIPTS